MWFTQLKQPLQRALLVLFLLGCAVGSPALADTVSSTSRLFKYDDSSGGKYRDRVALKAPKVATGQCTGFVNASIEYDKQRFGKVSIVSKPAQGCNPAKQSCTLITDAKHAPSGGLHFRVRAVWEVKASGC